MSNYKFICHIRIQKISNLECQKLPIIWSHFEFWRRQLVCASHRLDVEHQRLLRKCSSYNLKQTMGIHFMLSTNLALFLV
jgi:hypothetical protein